MSDPVAQTIIKNTVSNRAIEKLKRDMGLVMLNTLTVELICNSDGILWQEKLGAPMVQIGTLRRTQAGAIIETIAGKLIFLYILSLS